MSQRRSETLSEKHRRPPDRPAQPHADKAQPGVELDLAGSRLEDASRYVLALSLALFGLGLVIAVFGVSKWIELVLFAFEVASAGLAIWLADAVSGLKQRLSNAVRRHQHVVETLADRMWEMQESEARSRDLVDTLGDLVVHRDRDGRIVYANRIFAELVGSRQNDIVGRTLEELEIDVGLAADTAFSDGECLTYNDVAIHTVEGVRWFSWIELSARDETTGAVSHRAIARDITVRKNAETELIEARERAEQANRAKSRFLATVSHEIRTPLNGIMGMATLLADTRLSPEQRTYVTAVSTSSNALLALIEDLLDFSRIEAERFSLEPRLLSPHEMVENIVELLVARAHSKRIGIGCHFADDVPQRIKADPGRLRQVLLNVIGNAVKFTEQGGVLIDVSMGGKGRKRTIRFTVEDTGPGLKKGDRDRIFEEFEQGDGTSTRRFGGAGLGLAISKRILDAMGGEITVKSRRGAGTKFCVELPIGTAPARAGKGGKAGASSELAGLDILIVSPNAMESEAMRRTIVAHGGSAVLCDSVAAARSRAADGPQSFSAVLVDAVLETGRSSALQELSRARIHARRAVILIAPNDRGRMKQFHDSGYASFLARPVRGKTLLRVLRTDPDELRSSEPGAQPPRNSAFGPTVGRRRLSVLAADDNEVNAMLMTATLKKAGYAVTVVDNGKAAVAEATGGETFDVILMDLHMPVMDGLDAIRLIRRHEEEQGRDPVPILVLTADGQSATRDEVIAHGADGYVLKPLDPLDLVSAVEKAFSRELSHAVPA